jgi:2-polyprenyl-3-methyl-5-hydroxy-6-metoxy-1,4-benzoquinol methylase
MVTLSVVMPVYNEADTIAAIIDDVLGVDIDGVELQLVIIESNSIDGTREIVNGYASHPRVTLVHQDRARGKGYAVREGLRHTSGDIVMIQDGDLEYTVDDYPALLQPILDMESDFVLGCRHVPGRPMREFADAKISSRVLNAAHWVFTWLFNITYGTKLRDPFTMYKVFRRRCIEDLTFVSDRFDFDWELVAKIVRRGHSPLEVGVSYCSRGFDAGKKVTMLRDPITWLIALVRFRIAPISPAPVLTTGSAAPVGLTYSSDRCRCCGSTNVVATAAKVGAFSGVSFNLLVCRACSFRFMDPVVDPAAIYNDDYYRGKGADPLVDYEEEYFHFRTSARVSEYRDLRQLVERNLEERSWEPQSAGHLRWLDYGCGAGGLLRFLAEEGPLDVGGKAIPVDAVGFDPGTYSARLSELGTTVLSESELEALPVSSFDVVTCIEVLEHVMYPVPVVKRLAKLLAPGGLLQLTTGNLESPLARLLGSHFPYLMPEIHVSLFNPDLLANLYRDAGLEPVWQKYNGSIEFKIRKSLPRLGDTALVAGLAGRDPVIRFFDTAMGVSAMPSAVKPNRNAG